MMEHLVTIMLAVFGSNWLVYRTDATTIWSSVLPKAVRHVEPGQQLVEDMLSGGCLLAQP